MREKILVGLMATLLMGVPAMAAGNTGNLTMSGSTSVYPLAIDLAQAYNAQHTDKASFRIGQGGSGVGIQDVATGIVDIGNSSRSLKAAEVAYGLVTTVIARDAVAIVVHPSNPVQNLTSQQVAGIFNGTITNWSQVGGNNAPINVNSYTAFSGSDILDYFSEHFCGGSGTVVATANQWDSNGRLRQAVAADPNAIGFLSLAYLDNSLKAPNLDGQVVNLTSARSGQYKAVRNFNMVTKDQPTGLTKTFIDWVLSPSGQAIVAQDYLPPISGQAIVIKGHQGRQQRQQRLSLSGN
jgi:phosphate transport system substrate-binding protein